MDKFIIDEEIQKHILPPLHPDELPKLEANILADGEVREPLVVWNGVLLDGHNRWAIIRKHPELPYKIKEIDLPDRWAAIHWIQNNQLGRRNLTEAEKRLIVGNMYRAEQQAHGGDRRSEDFSSGQKGHLKNSSEDTSQGNAKGSHLPNSPEVEKENTRQRIAKATGTSEKYVRQAVEFAKGVEAAEEVSPGFRNAVLSGEIKAAQQAVAEIRKIPAADRQKVVESLKSGGQVIPIFNALKEKLEREQRQDDADYAVYKAFWKAIDAVMEFAEDPVSAADAVIRTHVDNPDFILSDARRVGDAIDALQTVRNRLLAKGGTYGKKK